MKKAFVLAVAVATGVVSSGVLAQAGRDNLGQLKQMRVSGTDLNIPTVPQEGRNAEAIRANLKRVKLPPGFRIDLFAVVPDARHMAVAPSTNMLFVGTRKTTVWAVTDRNGDGVADEVKPFAASLNFKVPNGVCWTKDGFLVVVEHNRILNFPAAEFFYEGPDVAVIEVVPQGGLVPVEEESYNHGARTCRVGDDGKLYVTLGQPHNVQPLIKFSIYDKAGIGGIVRMDPFDGSKREVVALGVRNSVGMDFNPRDKTLWFTDNQTDGLGDEVPPGELNHLTKVGQHFGYPYWGGKFKVAGSPAAPELKDMKEPAGAVFPEVEFPAHQAQLGMTFYNGTQFPPRYRSGAFVAAHGSWNRTKPTGALVNFVPVGPDGKAGRAEVFADGWLDDATGTYRGRPVDVAVMKDGSLLVSDDYAGAIYRITYAP
jgi:glucose/arabinose dehydrogenase